MLPQATGRSMKRRLTKDTLPARLSLIGHLDYIDLAYLTRPRSGLPWPLVMMATRGRVLVVLLLAVAGVDARVFKGASTFSSFPFVGKFAFGRWGIAALLLLSTRLILPALRQIRRRPSRWPSNAQLYQDIGFVAAAESHPVGVG